MHKFYLPALGHTNPRHPEIFAAPGFLAGPNGHPMARLESLPGVNGGAVGRHGISRESGTFCVKLVEKSTKQGIKL